MNTNPSPVTEFIQRHLNDAYDLLRTAAIASSLAIAAYLEPTYTFIIALFVGFTFNIFAGFRADEVRIKIKRIFPPLIAFEKFQGNKFKDSLAEVALILVVIYFLKGVMDLLKIGDQSTMVVQYLMIIAVYWYVRNGLRNLTQAYPKIAFLKILYILISFKFRDFFGDKIAEVVEKEEAKNKEKKSTNQQNKES